MKKVVRLNENDLVRIVKKVLEEQNEWFMQEPVEKQVAKIKPGIGGKYCFNPKDYYGESNQKVHLIKRGDTLEALGRIGNSMENILYQNTLCELRKGLKAGDVIIFSMAPSGRGPIFK